MNIVIAGGGEVGSHLAMRLAKQQHSLCLIEANEAMVESLDERIDGHVLHGNGCSVASLAEANAAEADVFAAVSGDDNANLVAASLAKSLGARKTIARAHMQTLKDGWLFDIKRHFGIDYLFSTQRLAAVELAKHVRNPEGLFVEELAKGRIEVQQALVRAGQPMAGLPLREAGLPAHVRIGSIFRENRLLIPTAADTLQAGDLITLFGNPEFMTEVMPRFGGAAQKEDPPHVVIFGGNDYGFFLAQLLEPSCRRVCLIERDLKICRQLSEALERTEVIHGDATAGNLLKEEQIGSADFLIAASEDDEDNLMACLQAKSLGTRYCLTLIHRADYAEVISQNRKQLQIHAAVSPREATYRDLSRFLTTEPFCTILELPGGAEVVEWVLSKESPLTGRKVADIHWPKGSLLVALIHGNEVDVPAADDSLEAEDTIYALVDASARAAFSALARTG